MTDDTRPKSKAATVVDPKIDAPILTADQSQDGDRIKLETGMTVGDAIRGAALWWSNKGRELMRDKNYGTDNPGYGSFNPKPTTVEEALNWLPSGVLMGKAWADLTQREKLQVTKNWHHNHVRVPNIEPELYQRLKTRPRVCFYCDEEACADEQLPNGESREMCWAHFMHRYPDEARQAHAQTGGPANDN